MPEEDNQLMNLVQLAYRVDIPEPTIQKFILFAINCAQERLYAEYRQRRH